ncbi:MAG: EAL domain-containing protein [Colwellia sp.]|nr:EAL domain-containing protein [Colwellia sp.]
MTVLSLNANANDKLINTELDTSNTFIEENTKQLKFSQLSTLNGLSNSNVFGITQDHQGFIWFATEDGLNRYDGNNVVTYRHNVNDKNSLAANFIRKIFIDSENTLWVGTKNGLSRYNLELDNFDNFLNEKNNDSSLRDNVIWDIYQNKELSSKTVPNQPLLWISTTQGLHTLSVKSDLTNIKFTRITVRNYNDRIREIKTIFQDQQQNYWLGSFDKGIHLLSKSLNYIGALKKQNKFQLFIDANALFDMKKIDNQYWLATDNGLYIVDDRYQLVSHLTANSNAKLKTSSNNNQQILLSNNVRAITQFDDNHVWVATHNGLNIINLLTHQVDSYQSTKNSTSISEDWLMDIYQDTNNTMWLASYGGGINKHSPLTSLFHHGLTSNGNDNYRVESFAETSDGSIWLSTEQQGLFKLSPSSIITKESLNLAENVWQVIANNSSTLWLRTESNKLYQYNTIDKKITEHKKWFLEKNYSDTQFVIAAHDSLWFINQAGVLAQYQTLLRTFNYYHAEGNVEFLKLQFNKNNLVLLTSHNEIVTFNIQEQVFADKAIKLPKQFPLNSINNLLINNDTAFFGSESQGLSVLALGTDKVTEFNESNSLRNNFIASLSIDDNNNIWLATNTGISVLTQEKNQKAMIHFDLDYHIKKPEFNKQAKLKSSKGLLFFGSANGFYYFSPYDVLQIKQNISAPIFTNLYVANKKIAISVGQPGKKGLHSQYRLTKQLNSLKQVELAYQQSPITFEFISPNIKLPTQLQYKYRLVGLEENWIDAATGNNSNRATYTNLSSGNYIFEVQAYDINEPKKAKTSQLNVLILPPWWLSTTMVVLYSFLALLFLIYVFQQYRNKQLYNSQIKESEERLKLSLWGSGDEMWDWNIVTDKIYRSNIWGILEFPQDGTRNKSNEKNSLGNIKTNIHQHDIERVKNALADHFAEKTEHFEATYRVKNKHNRWVWILDRGKIVERDENNNPARMTGTLKDISQIKKAEERLKLFAKCIQNISDAVVIYDRQFIAVDVNKAFQRITGKNKNQMVGRPLFFNQYPKKFTQHIKQHLVTKGSWHGEIESVRSDGSKYLTDLNIDIIHDENNNISHFVGVFSDITKRKETEAELRKLASSDMLTGLPNRSYFQANQARLVRSKINHALLVFDLDNFKKINDSLGHQVGDAILCQVAKRMLTLIRKQDTVYRLGGDEFSIIIENTNDIHTITSLAKNILRTVALPFKIKNQEIVLYSSIGIVLFPEDGITGHELLKNADTAMYHAKGSGGNKYQFFNVSMNKQAVKRLQIESLIRHGLKDDSFSVYYQPKIEIATGKIAGMEALVRFETPSKGIISPVVFIPVSEETGQIIDIGEVVLRKACFATKKWVDAGLFEGRVAVNLSAVQFTQSNLVTQIAGILQESQLPAKHLELEITEGTVMDSPQAAIDTMLQIRAMGIHLSLDDFGTGYSSLAYLRKFPLNTLKIDKAFIDDIEESEQGRNMVATIVTIAHNLGMDVVAEGVETNQQLSFLSGLRCEQLQGYLYSKPLATEHFQKYLLAHKIANKSTVFSR